jgi:hypothetical protein
MLRRVPATTPRIRHIPFRHLESGELHLRHLDEDPGLVPLLGRRPHGAEDLLKRAPLSARRLVPAQELGDALLRYAERHEAPAAVLENARSLADGKTLFVVTGQQPGLFGGPLYTVHKVATAIRSRAS